MKRRAVILAGGKGTRLRPYTVVLPKPLMPIGDYPILEVVIRQLVKFGFEHITIAVNHQAELIQAFFGNGSKWNVLIDYSLENHAMGTMGPLKLIHDLPPHFLIMNGDILTDLDFASFFVNHYQQNHLFTISSYVRKHRVDYGVLSIGRGNILQGFQEKPSTNYHVSMGIYMASREILEYLPEEEPFGFDDLMIKLLKASAQVNVNPFDGYWLDIGRPDDYMQAIEEFDKFKSRFIDV